MTTPGQIPFEVAPDVQGNRGTLIPKAITGTAAAGTSVWVDMMVLAATVAESYVIPAWANFINIISTTVCYTKFSGAGAAIPGTEVADGTGSVLSAGARKVVGGSTISFISPSTCIVSIEVWA